MRAVRSFRVALGFAGVFSLSAAVQAQVIDESARAATRQMALDGIAAYKKGQFQEAYDKVHRAYSVIRVPTLGLWTARSLERLGKLVESSERYLEIARLSTEGSSDAELQEAAKKAAATERAELLPRIPKLRVVIEGVPAEGVSVTIDQKPLPAGLIGTLVPVNPGEHRVTATLGKSTAEVTVTLAEKQTEDAVLELEPTAANTGGVGGEMGGPDKTNSGTTEKSSGSVYPILGYVGIGVGGAALVGGTVFGVMAMSTRKKLDAGDCKDGGCGPGEHPEVDKYNKQRNFATIGIVAGSVVAAAGVTLLIVAPKSDAEPRVGVSLGPASLSLSGTF
jgi:hypothetical protein